MKDFIVIALLACATVFNYYTLKALSTTKDEYKELLKEHNSLLRETIYKLEKQNQQS